MGRREYPLAAIVGGRRVKLALSLLAIDPLLRGALIGGGRGSGKTLIARAIKPLLPAGAPFIEVPPAVSIDRLSGGWDWTAALVGGGCRMFDGLLEEAKGGVLFCDHAGLLPPASLARIASALDISPSFVWVATHDSEDGTAPSVLL